MAGIEQQNYQVLIAQEDGLSLWRAIVLGMPSVAAQAESREGVIERIAEKLHGILQHAEIITVTPMAATNGNQTSEDRLAAMGWNDHGIFKNDPEALKLFDEIEEERSKHFIEPLQP